MFYSPCLSNCMFFFLFFFLDEHVNHEPQFIIVPSTRIAIWKVGKRHVLIKSLLISDLSSFFYYSLISVCVLWFFFFHFSWRITRGVFKTDRFRGGWGGKLIDLPTNCFAVAFQIPAIIEAL